MTRLKYLILGAGPSGLTFAHALLKHGEDSFLVLEKESAVGGLCRSSTVDGAPLDIGGGHFLDVRRKDALDLVFEFMPESEWNRFSRVAKIRMCGVEVDHPLEGNLWQLPIDSQVDFLESIARAGAVRGLPMPSLFEDWIHWKLGDEIARSYMLPYNRKMWRMPLNRLGTYWLHKLPDVSFRDTLLSCLSHNSQGSLPAHGTFLYPKHHGYGEVWLRMGSALGDRVLTSTPVTSVEVETLTVNSEFKADHIINSIPWTLWADRSNMPGEIKEAVSRLAHTSVDIDYVSETLASPAHWIYEPDEEISYHRILCRSNFCPAAPGYWTETNASVSGPAKHFRHRNEFAYPVNTIDKPEAMEMLEKWARRSSIVPLGRWGRWDHVNSDVAVSQAINAASALLKKTGVNIS